MTNQSTHTNSDTLIETITALSKNLIAVVKETFELATLETRVAGKSLLTIIALIFGGSMLLVTAWIFLIASATYLLVDIGLSWPMALALMASANFLLIIPVVLGIKFLHARLYFPITRRQLNTNIISLPEKHL